MELYSRNYLIVIWIWRALNRLFLKHIKVNRNRNKAVIDAFAMAHSSCYYNYAKIILVLFIPFYPTVAYRINITSHASSYFYFTALDVNVKFFSKNHISFVIVSIFVFLTLLATYSHLFYF